MICPICQKAELVQKQGKYYFAVPGKNNPLIVEKANWQYCNNCNEDILSKHTEDEIEKQIKEKNILLHFNPDWVIHPGNTIIEIIINNWAKANNINEIEIQDIINGEGKITPELAEQLSKLTGLNKQFYLNLQYNFDKNLQRLKEKLKPGKRLVENHKNCFSLP